MIIQCNNFDNFIMVAPGSDYGIAMWSDIKKVENAIFLDYVIGSNNRLIKLLHHIHFSFVINSKIQLPLQRVWRNYYSLENIDISLDKRYCIIFTDISACRVDTDYLDYLSGLENTTMVMVLVNIFNSKKKLLSRRLKYFDQIYSFDKSDCDQYEFIYFPTFYSITENNNDVMEIRSDAFFVGVSKDNRHDILKKLYKKITDNNGKTDFYISGCKDAGHREKGIHYNQWLDYQAVLDHVKATNCIVEIMGAGQSGLTLRAMEAIVYNKKLLTNNKSVKTLRFYESGYIKYFEDIDDVDVDFICNKELIDYQYNGEFSPIHLLERIDETIS